jgi:anti-sigma-K factor RskA
MSQAEYERQRIEELLAGDVLGDLSQEELRELQALPRDGYDELFSSLERTAAAVNLAGLKSTEPIPPNLASRLRLSGRQFLEQEFAKAQSTAASETNGNEVAPAGMVRPGGGVSLREVAAWLGLAVAILICVTLWYDARQPGAPPTQTASISERRQALLSDSDELIRTTWNAGTTPFPEAVDGDVVWSNEKQEGYMRFVGLPVNDPVVEQYQLWIIDPLRDEVPIDGGVFNITQLGESIVPIDPKLTVIQPKAFAITIEKPGGVVVSKQERLPLLAMVD